jgi:hypothetical protein
MRPGQGMGPRHSDDLTLCVAQHTIIAPDGGK